MNDRIRKAAEIAVQQCMNLKESETFLVVTDNLEFEIGNAIFDVARQIAKESFLLMLKPRQIDGEEPPEQVAQFMKTVDVIIAPTFKSLSHTEARRTASAQGARIATMPGILMETFVRAMIADYHRIASLSEKVAEALSGAKMARVKTAKGTDIVMSLEGRRGIADTGLFHQPGAFGNLPAGEGYIAPVEGTAEGTIVVDGSMGQSGVLSSGEYITLHVKNGIVEKVEGGRAAAWLMSILAEQPPEAKNIAELGIGTNYAARLCGSILEDEKVMGTAHIAIGDNASMGGNVHVPIHLDGIILSPTIWLDGKTIMRDGKLLIE